MRGEVLRYDDNAGSGLISGDDGQRYSFQRSDLQQLQPVRAGTRVDFVARDGVAQEVFLLDAQPTRGELESSNEDLSLWGYFTKCMGRSFNGEGRARRKEYWSFVLFELVFLTLGMLALFAVGSATGMYSSGYGYEYQYSPASALIGLGVLVLFLVFIPAGITVTVRRLHDVGLTGWFILIALVPYLGGIFLLIVSLIPSERRTNKHGLYPKPLD